MQFGARRARRGEYVRRQDARADFQGSIERRFEHKIIVHVGHLLGGKAVEAVEVVEHQAVRCLEDVFDRGFKGHLAIGALGGACLDEFATSAEMAR